MIEDYLKYMKCLCHMANPQAVQIMMVTGVRSDKRNDGMAATAPFGDPVLGKGTAWS